jgi:platelet-activating factor acetylhydrolase IB subunit beta/gamma
MNPSCPVSRNTIAWMDKHTELVNRAEYSPAEYVLLGDSIMSNFQWYKNSWKIYFHHEYINFGISGDRTQHVLWRVKFGLLPLHASVFIVHAGTNNICKNKPIQIALAILEIATCIRQRYPKAKIVITGLLPRGLYPSVIRDDIDTVNRYIAELSTNHHSGALYLKPENDWIRPNGTLDLQYYYKDKLHLIEKGYQKFFRYVLKILASCPPAVTTLPPCPPAAPTRPPCAPAAPTLLHCPPAAPTLLHCPPAALTLPPCPIAALTLPPCPIAALTLTPCPPASPTLPPCPPAAPTRRRRRRLRRRCHSPPPSSDDDDQSPAIQYLPRLRAVDFRLFDKLIS